MEQIQRHVISIALLVVLSCSLAVNNVAAQSSLAEQTRALNMIADFADRLCTDIPLTGNGLELTVKAKAELSGFIKKIADLGVEAAAKYHNYEGVLQKDLVKALKDSTTCKLEVFKELNDKILSPALSLNQEPCAAYKPMDAAYLKELFDQDEVTPRVRPLIQNAMEYGHFISWVIECGKVKGVYKRDFSGTSYRVSVSARYQDRDGSECQHLYVNTKMEGRWTGSTDETICRSEGSWIQKPVD